MAIRNGAQFIAGLKSRPRDVWVRGARVEDVTTHPAFAGAVRQLAALYDMQHDPQHQAALTYRVEETANWRGRHSCPRAPRPTSPSGARRTGCGRRPISG